MCNPNNKVEPKRIMRNKVSQYCKCGKLIGGRGRPNKTGLCYPCLQKRLRSLKNDKSKRYYRTILKI